MYPCHRRRKTQARRCHKVDESLAHVYPSESMRPSTPPLSPRNSCTPFEEGVIHEYYIHVYPTLLGRLAARRTESRQCLDPNVDTFESRLVPKADTSVMVGHSLS